MAPPDAIEHRDVPSVSVSQRRVAASQHRPWTSASLPSKNTGVIRYAHDYRQFAGSLVRKHISVSIINVPFEVVSGALYRALPGIPTFLTWRRRRHDAVDLRGRYLEGEYA